MQEKLGLYIHVPFCTRKCSYCAFVSFKAGQKIIDSYFDALLKEVELTSAKYKTKQVDTIYIGGGTPSYVDSLFITKLINQIKKSFKVAKNCEITIEVNPESTSEQKLKSYFDAGINRLSVGCQTTSKRLLKLLNRGHSYKQFKSVISTAKKIGFNNISADLIISLPTENMRILKRDLKRLVKLDFTHFSVYDLILEENTPFNKKIKAGELKQLPEKLSLKMQHYVVNYLKGKGYTRYEVSAYCKKGCESKHNLKYWNLEDYLGLGIASHSKIGKTRFENTSNLKEYIKNVADKKLNYKNKVALSLEEEKEEFIMLSLRKKEGINLNKYEKLFGDRLETLKSSEIALLKKENIINLEKGYLYLTSKGFDVLNAVIVKLI